MTWTPGHRRVPPGAKKIVGEHMIAIGIIDKLTVRLFGNKNSERTDIDVEDDTPIEIGEDIVLAFERSGKKFGLNLTELTGEELDALQKIITLAFDDARIIVEKRDEIAKEAMANGEAIFYRSLRGDPKVSVFRRTKQQHSPGVHGGHQNDVDGGGASTDHSTG